MDHVLSQVHLFRRTFENQADFSAVSTFLGPTSLENLSYSSRQTYHAVVNNVDFYMDSNDLKTARVIYFPMFDVQRIKVLSMDHSIQIKMTQPAQLVPSTDARHPIEVQMEEQVNQFWDYI